MQDTALYLNHVVTVLTQEIGVRSFQDISKLDRTAQYISGQFTSFGYQVTQQPFLFRENSYYNLVAEITGTASSAKVLIIGAHYDTVSTTSGADDNASGVAGLLAMARALAGMQLAHTVRFVAFALEEPPTYRTKNMGSYHYARSLKERKEFVEGMICLEMIGYFCDRKGCQHYPLPFFSLKFPTAGNYIALVGNTRSKTLTSSFAKGFQKAVNLPIVTLNAPPVVIGIDFSDHWSFGKFGYRAFMVTDTAFYRNPHYHTPSDTLETLDFERMAKVVEGLTSAVNDWGTEDLKNGR
jgi:Zn-dependent M28 family amino/carboxypeptidase